MQEAKMFCDNCENEISGELCTLQNIYCEDCYHYLLNRITELEKEIKELKKSL